jgi:tetratricopeptide (TPR) repeat protein
MAYTSEIEKLERRWKENPQGTVFAPLAEVYRKDGQYEKARDVLRIGLESNPGHIPGNIVLGRCCLDLKEDGAAEAAFVHVLELDAENVIALKALADITERQQRLAESEQWLRQLAAVDPSNDEAREQLARVNAARDRAAAALYPAPEPAPISTSEASPAEKTVEIPSPGVVSGEGTISDAAVPLSGAIELSAAGTLLDLRETAAPPEAPEEVVASGPPITDGAFTAPVPRPPEDVAFEFGAEDSTEIVLSGAPSALFQTPNASEELTSSSAAGTGEFQTPSASDELVGISHGSEFRVPDVPQELGTDLESQARDSGLVEAAPPTIEPPEAAAEPPLSDLPIIMPPEGSGEAVSRPAAPALPEVVWAQLEEPGETAAATEPPVPEPPAEEPAHVEPALVVTETMAELYQQQGHHAEAVRVYRELVERNPSDVRLQEKLATLETPLSGGLPVPAGEPGFAAASSTTGNESVGALFRSVLAARPPAVAITGAAVGAEPATGSEDEAASSGAPTRPAHDSLSLSAIFGEESSPVPPSVPQGERVEEQAPAPPKGAVSFDEFFGEAPAEGTSASPTLRPSRPGTLDEDLDQFQNWLKSLKR